MNLVDSSFLCLDIGTSCVRGIAHRIRSAKICKSAIFSTENFDTVFAIKSVIRELERQIGTHFDSAYITGNFGPSVYEMVAKSTTWNGEHKITTSDLRNQISQIAPPTDYFPMHIIPLRYDTPTARNMLCPVGHIDRQLISAFGTIYYTRESLDEIYTLLRHAYIQSNGFYDPLFLLNNHIRNQHQTTMFIDIGAQFTTAAIWTDRGPVWHTKAPIGGTKITQDISEKFKISFDDAERIKKSVASMIPKEMDRFTPADIAYDFSRGDVNDIILPTLIDIIGNIKETCMNSFVKYKPTRIVLTGGASEIEGLRDFIENAFATTTDIATPDTTVRALSAYIWSLEQHHRNAYIARHERFSRIGTKIKKIFKRHKKTKTRFIPIMPSTLCFNMRRPDTYTLFKSGGISMIHVDIMDGFYVDRIAGSIDELKFIRHHTDDHLHVHLMTESPTVWAADAISAGANTIILSTNTSGLRAALRNIRAAGRRCGVALNPDSSVSLLKPILREIDEVMIMSVAPGAAGQEFDPRALNKISVLAATRKKYGLKFTISVDGGINDKTAQQCWIAGADLLVSGSYLAKSPDFPLAVHSLLKNHE